jgi:hypothetical protein
MSMGRLGEGNVNAAGELGHSCADLESFLAGIESNLAGAQAGAIQVQLQL